MGRRSGVATSASSGFFSLSFSILVFDSQWAATPLTGSSNGNDDAPERNCPEDHLSQSYCRRTPTRTAEPEGTARSRAGCDRGAERSGAALLVCERYGSESNLEVVSRSASAGEQQLRVPRLRSG